MKKKTIQTIVAEGALLLEKFPDAYYDRYHYVDGIGGAISGYFSPSAKPLYLHAVTRRIDREPMLMATDAVIAPNDERFAILHPNVIAVPWLPVLRALKTINLEAYAALLDVVVRMSAVPSGITTKYQAASMTSDGTDVDAVITAELTRHKTNE